MQRIPLAVGAMVVLLVAGPLQAGVYTYTEFSNVPLTALLLTPQTQKIIIQELRNCPDTPTNMKKDDLSPLSLRRRYLDALEPLEEKARFNALTTTERVDLSGYLIRLGRHFQALKVLEEGVRTMAPDDPGRFLIYANLSSVYYEIGGPQNDVKLIERAYEYQEQALDAWPASWPGWPREYLQWYRRAELSRKALLGIRFNDAQASPGKATEWTTVDPLFGKRFQFIGPSGNYEAGSLKAEVQDMLPWEAAQVVLQLMLWYPTDYRVCWLYGELLNAGRDVRNAHAVLDDLCARNQTKPELIRHRQVLKSALDAFDRWELALAKNYYGDGKQPGEQQPILGVAVCCALAPRGCTFAVGLGDAMNDSIWVVAENLRERLMRGPEQGGNEQVKKTGELPGIVVQSGLPDWRQIVVSFIAGWLVCVLVTMQWNEWRKRTLGASPARDEPPHDAPTDTHTTVAP
jgi:tetratricopeptide (TPR) repeat protein